MYIFLDESGRPEIMSARGENLLLSGKTSKYLTIAVVLTDDPLAIHREVTKARNDALNNPDFSELFTLEYCLDTFHAHSDKMEIKRFFLNRMREFDFKAQAIVAEKIKAMGAFKRDPERFYNSMCGLLLRSNLHKREIVEVVVSRKDTKLSVGKNFTDMINLYRNEYLARFGISFKSKIFTRTKPHYSHSALQVVDYVAWAVHRAFETNDKSYYEVIESKISLIWDVFNKKYYTKRNPLS
jgi:hypothetical protein